MYYLCKLAEDKQKWRFAHTHATSDIPPDRRYQTLRWWYWGAACHVLGYERIYHRQYVVKLRRSHSEISEEWLVITIIHFFEHLRTQICCNIGLFALSKLDVYAACICSVDATPRKQQFLLDVHCYGKWFPSNSVACSRNGNRNGVYGLRQRQDGNSNMLRNNGNVMVETMHYSYSQWFTAWDFSKDHGNLGVDMGFGDFAMQSWDFYCHDERNILSEISPS